MDAPSLANGAGVIPISQLVLQKRRVFARFRLRFSAISLEMEIKIHVTSWQKVKSRTSFCDTFSLRLFAAMLIVIISVGERRHPRWSEPWGNFFLTSRSRRTPLPKL
jgi:hypothetical protein